MRYRPEIDGLRAIAVIPVVLFHAGVPGFRGGYVGVDVFFVISGYLITSVILADVRRGTFSFREFYERRIRRILPALLVVGLVVCPLAFIWFAPADLQRLAHSVISLVFFASNIQFYRESGYFDTETELKPLLHTWSLSVEEQFYVLLPLILLAFARTSRRRLLAGTLVVLLGSLLLAEHLSGRTPSASFYLLPTRAWELACGMWLSIYREGSPQSSTKQTAGALSFLGMAMILVPVATFDSFTHHPGLVTSIPVLGTVMVLAYGEQRSIANRVLAWRPVVFFGLMSYSLYLWHHPILAFARYLSVEEPPLLVRCGLVVASVAFAFLSLRFVERPFRNRERMSARASFSFVVGGVIVLLAFGLTVRAMHGIPSRFSGEQQRLVEEMENPSFALEDSRGRRCHRPSDYTNPCVVGRQTAPVTVVLIGDSHGGQLVAPYAAALERLGLAGTVFTRGGCAFMLDVERSKPGYDCARHNDNILDYLRTSTVKTVIVVSKMGREAAELTRTKAAGVDGGASSLHSDPAGRSADAPIERGYGDAIQRLLDGGLNVVVVYPVPRMGHDLRRHLFSRGVAFVANFKIDLDDALAPTLAATRYLDALGDRDALIRVYPSDVLCSSNKCPAIRNNRVLTRDAGHLSAHGASLVMDEIISKAARFLTD